MQTSSLGEEVSYRHPPPKAFTISEGVLREEVFRDLDPEARTFYLEEIIKDLEQRERQRIISREVDSGIANILLITDDEETINNPLYEKVMEYFENEGQRPIDYENAHADAAIGELYAPDPNRSSLIYTAATASSLDIKIDKPVSSDNKVREKGDLGDYMFRIRGMPSNSRGGNAEIGEELFRSREAYRRSYIMNPRGITVVLDILELECERERTTMGKVDFFWTDLRHERDVKTRVKRMRNSVLTLRKVRNKVAELYKSYKRTRSDRGREERTNEIELELEKAARVMERCPIKISELRKRQEEVKGPYMSTKYLPVEERVKSLDVHHEVYNEARRKLAEGNLRLVPFIARLHSFDGLDTGEMICYGNRGLMRAIDRFDYRMGFTFSTYATRWIRQSLQRGFASSKGIIKEPQKVQQMIREMRSISDELKVMLGRDPLPFEISREMRIPEEKVESLQIIAYKTDFSIDAEVSSSDERRQIEMIEDDRSMSPIDNATSSSLREDVEGFLERLTYGQREVLTLMFGLDGGSEMDGEEIARATGRTREAVRRLKERAFDHIRTSPSLANRLQEIA